jgi:hypothetical protein
MKFLDHDWCGFQWTDWIPLTLDQDSFSKIPSEPGLYRIRSLRDNAIVYIGQTGRSLKERTRTLRNNTLSEKIPFNDPQASPCLWAYRTEEGMDYEISVTPQDKSKEDRMAIECFLLWQYRVEKGSSTLCNHGRFHPRFTKSKDRKIGVRGELLEDSKMNTKGVESHPPLLPSGSIESQRWMSLDWSEWEELSLRNIQKIPTQPGVYRIYDSERREMLYLGESSNLRMRIQSHSRRGWESNAMFSYHSLSRSLPEYQRMEMENDLIGGYYLERVEVPRFQFGSK